MIIVPIIAISVCAGCAAFLISHLFLDSADVLRWNEEQVKQSCSEYGYGCFAVFEVHFNKTQWERSYEYPKSLFEVGYFQSYGKNKVHAGIIQFGGRGMILKGADRKKAEKLIKNKLKELPQPKDHKNTVDWGCKK